MLLLSVQREAARLITEVITSTKPTKSQPNVLHAWHMLRESRLYNERKERLYESKLKRMTHTAQ